MKHTPEVWICTDPDNYQYGKKVEAAKEALKIQQDPDSWALVFDVHNGEEANEPFVKEVDLNEEDI